MNRKNSKDHRLPRARTLQTEVRVEAGCAPWTLLLPDAAEGLLTGQEQWALDHHLAGCAVCTEEFAEAQRGLAWLAVLKDEVPEPPSYLLSSILAQTTGLEEAGVMLPELPLVAAVPHRPEDQTLSPTLWGWLRGEPGTWSSLLQPRLAMTGAMAFLSICITLNLLGISLVPGEASGAQRGSLQHTFADTGTTLIRSFQGLRMVYRVESRVNEMRAEMNDPAPASSR